MNCIARLWIVLFVTVLAGTACSTHEEKYERDVPPRPVDRLDQQHTAITATTRLIMRLRPEVGTLPPEALAALAKAAALLFEATGAPGMQRATQIFGGLLLQARVPAGAGQAFYSSAGPGRPSAEATVEAGDALIDVFLATRDVRYRAAVAEATRAATSRRLGWTRFGNGFAMKNEGARHHSVSQTASAAAFLVRAAAITANPNVRIAAVKALTLVNSSQAAVGRWYENFGTRSPMTLESWARTLLALGSADLALVRNTEEAGALFLWSDAFNAQGMPLAIPLLDRRGLGVAMALGVLQHADTTKSYADLAYRYVLDHRRPDGTVELASAGDALVQAYYALAFAQRAYALRTLD